ncbi:MAG: hypothetical protein Q8M09_01165 [Pseudomonadota bacterium]|nr:hypothetical protein [Pseudomonadota bacterium]MDP1902855.1 hypothetical protein [Pseudomonadota bacterium]MDP2352831.1 hypothetical protein [Pseudomonadota bacterium]
MPKGSNQIGDLGSSHTGPVDENPESYPTFFIAMIESGKHANDLEDDKPFPAIIMFYNFRYPEFSTTIAPPNNFGEFTYT